MVAPMKHFMDFAATAGWAMLPEAVENLVAIAERSVDINPEILEAYRAKSVENADRLRARDGVGILYAEGPMFKKSNLMTSISGATSYQILARDLQAALDDRSLHSIALLMDTPGGEANGADEFAAMLHAANKIKPVTTYVSGMGASAGYWMAAGGGRIILSEASMVGSIGVVLGINDTSLADEKRGVRKLQFVSSQSPNKRPDPNTESGKSHIQAMVDSLASVFISKVAAYRGVSEDDVIAKFGAGGMKVGAEAVAAGMADGVGQFEDVLATMISDGKSRSITRHFGGLRMSEATLDAAAITAAAETAAQNRMKAILASEAGKAIPTLASHLAYETKITAEDAGKILTAAKADVPAPAAVVEPVVVPPVIDPAVAAAEFAASKTAAGALGLGRPAATGAEKPDASALWGKAVANVNRGIGAA
jgi:ClpP class serine protease